jgi:ATP-binding cassette subfamily B (MDR/TAP) protein 7
VLNVQVPFWFKEIVDGLNMDVTEAGTVWMVVGWSILGCASSLSVP